jgi:uncharacterized protein (DUF1330 family)
LPRIAVVTGEAFTIGFVGRADPAHAGQARAYEDAVLPLLADHGAKLLYRGVGTEGREDAAQPIEIQLIWFPNRAAYMAYIGDERRLDLLTRYGDVFTEKMIVDLETITAFTAP